MPINDFSFKNTQIKAYFEGSDKYVPSSELIYIHSHPLVKPNFLDELEALILKTTDLIQKKNIRGSIIDKIGNLTMQFGAELPTISQENAPKILSHLRDIYKLCTGLLKNHNIVYA
jgi:hypothetical protein